MTIPSSAYYFGGYIDEFRISPGIARWTSNFTPPTLPYCSAPSGTQIFAYTGAQQTYTVPSTGNYKIELWGAQGGNTTYGGTGGYVSGTVSLTAGTVLNIYVGGTTSNGSALDTVAVVLAEAAVAAPMDPILQVQPLLARVAPVAKVMALALQEEL